MFHNTPLQKYGHKVEIASNFYDEKLEIRPDENLEINSLPCEGAFYFSPTNGRQLIATGHDFAQLSVMRSTNER